MRAEIEWNEKLLIDLEWPKQKKGRGFHTQCDLFSLAFMFATFRYIRLYGCSV